jgi:serine phosphatase RsbU (regulator of sigma subunit)
MDSQWFAPTVQGSEMGKATLAFPWETTPLGPIDTWGESLRQTARMCFSTKFPVLIAWGPELTMVYNDAYREMLGTHKCVGALGAPLQQVWPEVWDTVGPLISEVMATRLPMWATDAPMMVNRSGFEEETFFTFSYSPLVDDAGEVVGILDISTETTAHVVTQRRLALIDSLHSRFQDPSLSRVDLASTGAQVLSSGPDVARCAVSLRTGAAGTTTLCGDRDLAAQVPGEVVDQVMATLSPTVVGPLVVAPLTSTDSSVADGVLIAEAGPARPVDVSLRSFVMLGASTISGALRAATIQQVQMDYLDARARVLELEAASVREASIALQSSLLTDPPEPDHLHVVVRYQPAARDLQIGGDWYDAFLTHDGATTLVVGDVTGHDHHAAAAMGQLRGLIRAIAYDSGQPPARVLERTDAAITGLNLSRETTATAVVARIEQSPLEHLRGVRTVRWSNAAHPYPVLVRADGTIEVLQRQNDVPLGILHTTQRVEHETLLYPGDTLFFYTDGLIERRTVPMSQSTSELVASLAGAHDRTLDELADHVLTSLAPGQVEDDVALVLVRAYPEDAPRPAEAGPRANIPENLPAPR